MDGCVTLGSIWEERLRGIYSEASSTYKQLALHLGVSEAIVKKEIIRLGLIKYSDRESIVLPTQPVAPRKIERPKKAIDKDSRERNRQLWRDTREANPSVGRFKLRTKVPTVFNWLYKNDKEWLEANSPARQTTKGSSGYIDWSERDAELAREIRHSAEKITNAPGRPIRASSACIAKRIGKLTVISKHGDKLPLTIKALNEVAEDVENYAMRRVLWAVDYYREKGICAAPWQLQIKACLSNKIAKNQE
jgi:hypothetical protein